MTDKLAFVFPGQGSQQVGMLAEYAAEPVVQTTFAEAADILGFDLWQMICAGPLAQLNQTENTQPALLAASVALWRVWQVRGGQVPAVMAGHSLGEYSALVCAGAISYADGLELVRARGRFMQEAVAPGTGAMAAIIGLDDAGVVAACDRAADDGVVEAVNYNAPGQVVIAGQLAAVQRAMAYAREAGAKRAIELPVSVPSHCALMKPAAERLAEQLASVTIQAPAIAVIQNVSASACFDPEQLKTNLVAQLYSPVRWVESVEAMLTYGVSCFSECGPGKVLAGLNKRIARQIPVVSLDCPAAMAEMLAEAD